MKITKYYKVAEHIFSVNAEEFYENYEPFLTEKTFNTVFSLEVLSGGFNESFIEEVSQDEEGQKIICGHTDKNFPLFEMWLFGNKAGVLVCQPDYKSGLLYAEKGFEKFSFDNALMIIYALATASESTLLFHSSVIAYENKAYMFLGKSGTGKSTHSRLWLKNFQSAALLNDDNPVVRIFKDKSIKVYGSPWSGKTPCYKNLEFPLGGIVSLSQAKSNKISELKGVCAYATIVTAISGKRWDRQIADSLHESENFLAQNTKMYKLDCLPDDGAAVLCKETITNDR